jgi:hypothetical protein
LREVNSSRIRCSLLNVLRSFVCPRSQRRRKGAPSCRRDGTDSAAAAQRVRRLADLPWIPTGVALPDANDANEFCRFNVGSLWYSTQEAAIARKAAAQGFCGRLQTGQMAHTWQRELPERLLLLRRDERRQAEVVIADLPEQLDYCSGVESAVSAPQTMTAASLRIRRPLQGAAGQCADATAACHEPRSTNTMQMQRSRKRGDTEPTP